VYCQHCGNPIERETPAEAEVEAVEETASAEVEIERIRADKEVKIAQINARVVENVTEVDQAAELAHAEGKAEGMEEALSPGSPEPATDAPDVVVQTVADDEPEETTAPAPEPSDAPTGPPSEHKSHGYGNPLFFGS
jgi:hypothetical protein